MEYTEIRILTVENETFSYVLAIASYLFTDKGINRLLGSYNLRKCIIDNVMLASILIINCVDIEPVATTKSIF